MAAMAALPSDSQVGGQAKVALHLMAVPPHAAGCPPQWSPYVTVDDVDAMARKVQELGTKTIMPLTDIPNVVRFYTFQDPQGAVISIITSYVGSHRVRRR